MARRPGVPGSNAMPLTALALLAGIFAFGFAAGYFIRALRSRRHRRRYR